MLSDLQMPRMDGIELVERIRERWPELPCILISVEEDIATAVRSVRRGAVNYLVKPCEVERIRDAVDKALRDRPRAPSLQDAGLFGLFGRSRAMVELRHSVVLAARSDVNVLIAGRTGTGKELVAQAIHRLSNLAHGPWIPLNCAACPRELFEDTLFGHRRGAFTGADEGRSGLLAQAHDGTFFLDELQAMEPDHQAKLLRVLDHGEYRPVGSTETQQVSVRFVAATDEDPQDLIRTGALREDLYYRLRGYEIHVPPLAERAEDIPALAQHFLGEDAERLTSEAFEALGAHGWPGNVRELENVLKSGVVQAGSGRIEPRHLQLTPAAWSRGHAPAARQRTLREAEVELIRKTLEACRGNRSEAARILGIDRSTLRRKLAEPRNE